MELQTHINSSDDIISDFKKYNFKIHNFKKLKIISYRYDSPPEYKNTNDLWKLYCKGVVIDENNKIICLSPIKSFTLNDNSIQYGVDEEVEEAEITYEHLIDGTMINLFYYQGEWIISTRSEIGGYNKWTHKKSFRQMFDECSQLDYDLLNKNMSYSFSMRHVENRNVSPITQNQLILIDIYDFSNDTIRLLNKSEYPENIHNTTSVNESHKNKDTFMKMYQGPIIDYYIKGFTIRYNNIRYKWINPYFDEVKNLKINMNNHLLNYIELRQNGNLKKYIRYFPEHQHLFNNYRDKIHDLSNELFLTYKNVFIYKKMDKKEIPYHLKPLVYEIHKQYLETKNPTMWQDIKDYIHTLPSKKLTFALNHI